MNKILIIEIIYTVNDLTQPWTKNVFKLNLLSKRGQYKSAFIYNHSNNQNAMCIKIIHAIYRPNEIFIYNFLISNVTVYILGYKSKQRSVLNVTQKYAFFFIQFFFLEGNKKEIKQTY